MSKYFSLIFISLVCGVQSLVYDPLTNECTTNETLALSWANIVDVDDCLKQDSPRGFYISNYTVTSIISDFNMSFPGPVKIQHGGRLEFFHVHASLGEQSNLTFGGPCGENATDETMLIMNYNTTIDLRGGALVFEPNANVTLTIVKPSNLSTTNLSLPLFFNCSAVHGGFSNIIVVNESDYSSSSTGGSDSETSIKRGTMCYRTVNTVFEFLANEDEDCSSSSKDDPDLSLGGSEPEPDQTVNVGPLPFEDVNNESTQVPSSATGDNNGTNSSNTTTPTSESDTTDDNEDGSSEKSKAPSNTTLLIIVFTVIGVVLIMFVVGAVIAQKWKPLRKRIFPYRNRPPQDAGTV